MNISTLGALILFMGLTVTGHASINKNGRNVALDGYDVVAYFKNHQNEIKDKGRKGSPNFSSKYNNVNYYFSSEENKKLFESSPETYVPAYGGWCAWAMSYGTSGVSVNYNTFLISLDASGKEKLYLFYNFSGNNTLENWVAGDHEKLVKKADATWKKAK